MLLLIGAFVTLIVLLAIASLRRPKGVNTAKLGWMSEKWLAEYRASHQS